MHDATPVIPWNRDSILRQLLQRESQGLPLTVMAIRKADESLYKAARQCFGSWHNAIAAAGIRRGPRKSAWRGNAGRIIAAIRRAAQHPGMLAYSFMMKRRRRLYDAAINHFGTWRNALLAAGIDPESVRKLPRWNKDNIIEAILSRALRNQPLGTTTVCPQSLSSAGASQFGSWPAALRAAGLDPKKYVGVHMQNRTRVIPSEDAEEQPFHFGAQESGPRPGPPSRWTYDRIAQETLRRFHEGKAMNNMRVRAEDKPLYRAAVDRLRCWSNALALAGLNHDFFRKDVCRSRGPAPQALGNPAGQHGIVISYSRAAVSSTPRCCPSIKRQKTGNRAWIRLVLGPYVPFCELHDVGSGLRQGKGLRAALNLVCYRTGVFIVEDLTRISRCVPTADGIVQGMVDRGWRVVVRRGVPPSEDQGTLPFERGGRGVFYTSHRKPGWTKETVAEEIRRRATNNEPLIGWAIQPHHLLVVAEKFFGSWESALEAAGVGPPPTGEESNAECSSADQPAGNVQEGAQTVAPEKASHEERRPWTDEAVIQGIQGRLASQKPLNEAIIRVECSRLYGAARNRFGSWVNALTAAGLNPDDIRKGPKRT